MLIRLALIPIAMAAQELPDPATLKVDVNLVNVAFIVRDPRGLLNTNLTKEDVEIYEDGVKQDIRFFSRSNDLPLRLGLLADFSGSQDKFIGQHHRDLKTFVISAITLHDRAMLICFGNHIRLVSDFTSSPDQLMDALEVYQDRKKKTKIHFPEIDPDPTRRGGTALFDAVYAGATEKMAARSGTGGVERKALILFSDGEDNSSAHDLMDAIEAAETTGALIYTVRYTEPKHGLTARNRYGTREMDRLAQETGGAAFDSSKKDVGAALREVGEELRSMYDVGYISSNPARDATFRKVLIRTKGEGLVVRAKPGYFSP